MILCLGTTPAVQRVMVFDRFALGEVNRAVEVREGSAGKSINVAKVAHALGRPTHAISFVGQPTGALIRRELQEQGVSHDLIEVPSPTRTCITTIDRGSGRTTELVEEAGAVNADAWAQLEAKFTAAMRSAEILILSGSIAPGGSADLYAHCIRAAGDRGIPVILDAQGEPLRRALPLGPLVVKPNRAELAATVGMAVDSDSSLRQAIARLIDSGPKWAVITMGPAGAIVSDGRSCWRVRPPRIATVNPIGSGDAFSAGLATALLDGRPMPEACRLATACGAANALQLMPGVVRIDDVRRLEPMVEIEPWQSD